LTGKRTIREMLIRLYNENPNPKDIRRIADILKDGGIIIYPTDTVYGMGCDISVTRAVERVAQLKGIDVEKSNFSFICSDLSHLSLYTRPISNQVFKIIRKNSPGPFTFILEANNHVPKYFKGKKKTVGIRIPDNNIICEIVRQLGNPIVSTSIHDEDEMLEYSIDPELIHEKYRDVTDVVIDGGFGEIVPSTIVDFTGDEPVIIRQGKGVLQL
jgi:tRNA threonylcarbamoyl adenosine modification protein (Sua5/YciO/YrdC/YwlC family)